MSPRSTLRRRKFIQAGASAVVAGTTACTANRSPWRFFTLEEARTLDALCEQIIPTDQDPGASWAGAVRFVDRQLTGFLKPLQSAYREGLAAVNQACRVLHGAPFADLAAEKQAAVLSAMEKNKLGKEAWPRGPAKPFFDLLVSHTMQGYYGGPRHGGNRDAVSWRMLGVPIPPVRGRAQHDLRKG